MNHWFRLYNTLVDDPKVQQLPEPLFKALINLWCVASQNDGVLPGNADIAYKLRVKPEKSAEYVSKLLRAGLLDNVDGVFVPHNWDSRQFQSDNSTSRVTKYRDKRRAAGLPQMSDYSVFRPTLIQRDGERCVYCDSTKKLVVDHMVPITLGGTDHPDNLALACKPCNSGKSGRTPEMAGMVVTVTSAMDALLRYRDTIKSVTVTETSRAEQSRSNSDQSTAEARPLDANGLKEETALRLLFMATRTGLHLSVPNMDHIKVWLADGIGKGTISAAVTPILTKKADMASLAYCDAVVREKHAKSQAVPSLEPVPLTDDDWRGAAKRFKENRSLWSRHAGPEPGMAGCRCPAQVLVNVLIDPSTGFDIGPAWHFITEGTPEMAAFVHDAQTRKARPPRVYELEIDGVTKRGFYSGFAVPAGYDEATGERLQPQSEDAA